MKRVYALRTALHAFDFQDPAADDMKVYLRRCVRAHPPGSPFWAFLIH